MEGSVQRAGKQSVRLVDLIDSEAGLRTGYTHPGYWRYRVRFPYKSAASWMNFRRKTKVFGALDFEAGVPWCPISEAWRHRRIPGDEEDG